MDLFMSYIDFIVELLFNLIPFCILVFLLYIKIVEEHKYSILNVLEKYLSKHSNIKSYRVKIHPRDRTILDIRVKFYARFEQNLLYDSIKRKFTYKQKEFDFADMLNFIETKGANK